MKIHRIVIALALALGGLSCSQNKPKDAERAATLNAPDGSADRPAGKAQAAQAGGIQAPVPPADAQWTIYCQSIISPDHVMRAREIKEQLVKSTGMKDWYVLHGEDQSTIYYGYYRSINDPRDAKESKRAQADRQRVDRLGDAYGNRPFRYCMFVQLSAPDPVAPPEFDLANSKGYWSLQIAAYKDNPLRKEAAVEAVKEARKQGIEAYYYHGETVSSVCIGSWPMEAVKMQETDVAASSDPSQPIAVLPDNLPPELSGELRTRDGKAIKSMAPKLEAQDPTMIVMMKRYPTHAINGAEDVRVYKDPKTGKTRSNPVPSFLVRVPRAGPSILTREGGMEPVTDPAAEPSQQDAPSRPTPGAGTLRSLGG